jgi:gamma-glutamyltranspeptidase/glutathione hydrolase
MDDFSSKPGVPNIYGVVGAEANKVESRKRMLSSMSPTFVFTTGGRLWLVLGTPGGPTIFTSVFQVIVNKVDYRLTLEQAVNAPRFHHQWPPPNKREDPIRIETLRGFQIPGETLKEMRRMGYAILPQRGGHLGDIQAIEVTAPSAVGVSDKRGKGKVESE